jgi:5-hydroxyisourate hydrolase
VSPITAHVLDTALGRPAAEVAVRLDALEPSGVWTTIAEGATNEDGRVNDLLIPGGLTRRTYRMTFATGPYFEATARPVFYPRVEVIFAVERPAEHHHIPLLLSPFGYSTYRGN